MDDVSFRKSRKSPHFPSGYFLYVPCSKLSLQNIDIDIIFQLSLCIFALFYRQVSSQDSVGPIGDFIRANVVGRPVIHDRKQWIFDPDVSQKRRKTFRELHGDLGEKLIERLGLGIDGRDEERLTAQRQRDEGHLGGLNSLLPQLFYRTKIGNWKTQCKSAKCIINVLHVCKCVMYVDIIVIVLETIKTFVHLLFSHNIYQINPKKKTKYILVQSNYSAELRLPRYIFW